MFFAHDLLFSSESECPYTAISIVFVDKGDAITYILEQEQQSGYKVVLSTSMFSQL